MNMASTSQAHCFTPLRLKIINDSSKFNHCVSIDFKTYPFNSLKISATSSSSDSQSSSPTSQDQNPNPISKSVNKSSNLGSNPISEPLETEAKDVGGGKKEMPLALKLAMEKAKKYKEKKGDAGTMASNIDVQEKKQDSDLKKVVPKNSPKPIVDRKLSRIDFVGFNFSDKKKTKGLPPGLVPMENNFSEKALSDVELILGDPSKFGSPMPQELNKQDETDIYKPQVSTWGVFPRPSNISKTFGGGRTIRPGDLLETEEEKREKDARTKRMLEAYKNKMGLNIDPKIISACKKALMDGDSLMDKGKLKDALPFYEKVMKDLSFQNELHGLAALQWSICQDSLTRRDEARVMYKKLQSHPNAAVRKKAKQFVFSFEAMDMLKVNSSSLSANRTDYGNYFEAFVQDKTSYPGRLKDGKEGDEEEYAFQQVLPYIVFLASPLIFVLYLAVKKGI